MIHLDALEAFTNSTLGFAASYAATFFVLGYSATESAAITAMFFAISTARSYVVRRLFRRLANV